MKKQAGAVVYLMEELGDARLRCDQLVGYVAEAVKLVNGSPAKASVYEVAGHLIDTIPVTLFKLQKSLQASALAAGRMDYEELKQELQPEKLEELDRILRDVRVRQVTRRSNPLTQFEVAQSLEKMASDLRKGSFQFEAALDLISDLEQGVKSASTSESAAQTLEGLASALKESPTSRVALASQLRKFVSSLLSTANLRLAAAPDKSKAKLKSLLQDIEADAEAVMDEASAVVSEALKSILKSVREAQKL